MAVDTLANAKLQYLANLDYDAASGDTAKARAFIEACRALKIHLTDESEQDGSRVRFAKNVAEIETEQENAERWINREGGAAGGVKHIDLRNFRQ